MAVLRADDVWEPEVFPRGEFASRYFHYKAGQHVLFAGPTQRAGKTSLCFALLEHVASTRMPAYIAVSKPDDPVTLRESRRLGYRIVKTWPVEPKVSEMWDGKPPGYVIWPDFGDIDTDAVKASKVTADLLRDLYKKGVHHKPAILVLDDTVVKSKLLGLDRYMVTHIAMAGAMKTGGWYFVQKPTDSGQASLWAYGNSAHIFLSKDEDKKNRDRYDEIGGFPSHQVREITLRLRPYQFLYLGREHGSMCIVDSR